MELSIVGFLLSSDNSSLVASTRKSVNDILWADNFYYIRDFVELVLFLGLWQQFY